MDYLVDSSPILISNKKLLEVILCSSLKISNSVRTVWSFSEEGDRDRKSISVLCEVLKQLTRAFVNIVI